MPKEQYVVGLDLGSYYFKVSAVTGKNGDIIFSSYGESAGIINGRVTDEVIFLKAVRDVLRKIEIKIGQPVKNVYLSVDIGNTRNVTSLGSTGIISEIATDEEINRAIISSLRFPAQGDSVADIEITEQKVDGVEYKDVNGVKGTLVDLKTQIFFVRTEMIKKIAEILRKEDIEIYGTGIQMRGVSNLVVSDTMKKKGILVVDSGHSKTDMCIYKDNEIKKYDSLDVGGKNITKDLSIVLKISMEEAEELKIQYGNGLISKNNKRFELIEGVILARIDEMIQSIGRFLEDSGLKEDVNDCCLFGGGLCGFKNINKYMEEKLSISTNAITSDIIKSDDIFTLNSIGVAYDIIHDIQTEIQLDRWDEVLESPNEKEHGYLTALNKLGSKAKDSVKNLIGTQEDEYYDENENVREKFENRESINLTLTEEIPATHSYSPRDYKEERELEKEENVGENKIVSAIKNFFNKVKDFFRKNVLGYDDSDYYDDEDEDDSYEEEEYNAKYSKSVGYEDALNKDESKSATRSSKDKYKNNKNRYGIE